MAEKFNHIRVKSITKEHFVLRDGRRFRHLFPWSHVPLLADFENLLTHCYDMMTDSSLMFVRKKKGKDHD